MGTEGRDGWRELSSHMIKLPAVLLTGPGPPTPRNTEGHPALSVACSHPASVQLISKGLEAQGLCTCSRTSDPTQQLQ